MTSYSKDDFLGTRVLVTGGTGFMGSAVIEELLSQTGVESVCSISRRWDDSEKLARKLGDTRFYYQNGDIRDASFVNRVVRDGDFDVIIHAAAYKSVPSAQTNPEECIGVNTKGSINVANAAKNHDVKAVVGISTDKACEPINVYGQTKAIMEQVFVNSVTDKTNFLVCRYGNVVGSTGSVIPLFIEQLKQGKPLTVTDPDMTRFWFPKKGAVDFVLMTAGLALNNEHRGKVLVPDLRSIRMGRLADYMCFVWGQRLGKACAGVSVVGPRGGEKVHELMIGANEDKSNMYFISSERELINGLGIPFSSENQVVSGFDDIDAILNDYWLEVTG